jgi:hypothetical protein
MRTPDNPAIASEAEQVRKRFEDWRLHNHGRPRLPQELWSAAVELARDYGLNRTARELRLSYDSLKKHMPADAAVGGRRRKRSAKFIELLPLSSATVPECSLELENARGAKMKIQLKGAAMNELSTLTRLFWSQP